LLRRVVCFDRNCIVLLAYYIIIIILRTDANNLYPNFYYYWNSPYIYTRMYYFIRGYVSMLSKPLDYLDQEFLIPMKAFSTI
jgi:hypothetical protein